MFVMVELAASDLCNIRDHSESRAQCSARRFQVHGVSVDADEHRLLTPCQPVGLCVIWGFAWLLGLCLGLCVTTLQDGEGYCLQTIKFRELNVISTTAAFKTEATDQDCSRRALE